jgi:hypothetical protein
LFKNLRIKNKAVYLLQIKEEMTTMNTIKTIARVGNDFPSKGTMV